MNFESLYDKCAPYTMTCKDRVRFLYESVLNVVDRGIEGDFVETGIWKGGNLMLMYMALQEIGEERVIWGYDRFEDGMPKPDEYDLRHDGKKPDFSKRDNLRTSYRGTAVRLTESEYYKNSSTHSIRLIAGNVEDTIPSMAPSKIAILRTDTDFYRPTKHTLGHLFPRITKGGIFINDDYGHFQGAKKACDEYGLDIKQIANTNAYWCRK